jgi:hypothetical protein
MDSFIRAAAAVDVVTTTQLGPGDVLADEYEIVERIGVGGMATVFRAHARQLDRDVAIKVPRLAPGAAGQVRAMFAREARMTARLAHPNIVTLHNIGDHDGLPFVVLELLHGETLAQRLARDGALATEATLDIVEQILRALAFAHARGVVHRDLTPHNVFLSTDGTVKVLDFGVAVDVGGAPGTVTRGAGTRGYKAPQQGTVQDPRNDLWSTAVILVECLHGLRPSADATAQLPAGLPRHVRELVARALSPDLAERPSSAAHMRQMLRPAPARRPAARRHTRRGLVLVLALGVSALVGTSALGGAEGNPREAHVRLPRDGRWRADPGGGTSWETRLARIDATHYGYEHHNRESGRTSRGTLRVDRVADGSTLLSGRIADVPNCPTCTNVGFIEFIVLDERTLYQNRAAWGASHDRYVEWFPPYRYKWLGTLASGASD